MPVSHNARCIFVHVPKTGGTSVETALGMFGRWQDEDRENMFGLIQSPDLLARPLGSSFLQHLSIHELRDLLAEGPGAGYFSFAFVRNPWDRMVSIYHRPDPHLLAYANGTGIELAGLSFREFLARTEGIAHAHLAEQAQYVCDDSGKILVDYLGRFETLERDYTEVCRRLHIDVPLPRLNGSAHNTYRSYYDENTKELLAGRYRKDIEIFGYKF